MRIAAFLSHPIQYFSPLFRELSARPGVELTVFYFARQGIDAHVDPDFGVEFAWDIDLLSGYSSKFLPRRWPTTNPADYRPRALNAGFGAILQRGWDVAFVNGYAHINNWIIAARCKALGIPLLCFGDTNPRTDRGRSRARALAKRAAISVFFSCVAGCLAAGGQTRQYFASYNVPNDRIFICPYAVDVSRFRARVAHGAMERAALRKSWRVPDGARIVMFCGKLAPWKRPGDVLLAVQRLRRPDVLAVFVGDGEQRASLEAESRGVGRFPGFVNQRDIPLALSLADVLVLPSAREPYGMVVSEAQALGVPAVVSDQCGCHGPESVLWDGRSGFVYPCGHLDVLASRIASLLDDESLHSRMCAAARIQGETQSAQRAADGFLEAVDHVRVNGRRTIA